MDGWHAALVKFNILFKGTNCACGIKPVNYKVPCIQVVPSTGILVTCWRSQKFVHKSPLWNFSWVNVIQFSWFYARGSSRLAIKNFIVPFMYISFTVSAKMKLRTCLTSCFVFVQFRWHNQWKIQETSRDITASLWCWGCTKARGCSKTWTQLCYSGQGPVRRQVNTLFHIKSCTVFMFVPIIWIFHITTY